MTEKQFKFANGQTVKEKITGFKGVITGTAYYITGCNQYLIVPKCQPDGKVAEGTWYDEGRLVLQKGENWEEKDVEAKENGADTQAPNKG